MRGFIYFSATIATLILLSASYIFGVESVLKSFQTYYSRYTSNHLISKFEQPTTQQQLKNIDREMHILLKEIEKQSNRINFSTIDFLPKLSPLIPMPDIDTTLAAFFDTTILKPSKKVIKSEQNITKPTKLLNQIIVKEAPKNNESTVANRVQIKVNLSSQRMNVYKDGKLLYHWKVSTGKRGYSTPTGKYQPQYLVKMHHSRKYNNAPMPYSIFFHGGYACHGTNSVWRLGQRASHGCIRLKTSNAKKLFYLVHNVGKDNSAIHITH